jgi:hypothetical protein
LVLTYSTDSGVPIGGQCRRRGVAAAGKDTRHTARQQDLCNVQQRRVERLRLWVQVGDAAGKELTMRKYDSGEYFNSKVAS